MALLSCRDFDITVGRNVVTVHFDFNNHRVCWASGRDRFCVGLDTLSEMRRFLNEYINEPPTSIVNEFQFEFAIRRQRAFWIVESMLDPRWCVVEAVAEPGCVISGGEYATVNKEYSACFEGVIDTEDLVDAWFDAMSLREIKVLDHCGAGATYTKLRLRLVPFSETECSIIEYDYGQWINDVMYELQSYVTGE